MNVIFSYHSVYLFIDYRNNILENVINLEMHVFHTCIKTKTVGFQNKTDVYTIGLPQNWCVHNNRTATKLMCTK